ncbi:macrophage mannose receptor 1 [Elysia marginata]|uniref:Macrophage mannose receptor 1 n=1 Tax=Elysia marginata TaxID=1093978 RepID=A0AAV4IZP4_9GAST|nr:macrophage mannose receptor 1 [Elysia marginata]
MLDGCLDFQRPHGPVNFEVIYGTALWCKERLRTPLPVTIYRHGPTRLKSVIVHNHQRAYIGLRRPKDDVKFYWLDDKEPAAFTNLDYDRVPTRSEFDGHVCGVVEHNSVAWGVTNCRQAISYICEKRPIELCPPGWTLNWLSGTCIKVVNWGANWYRARQYCQKRGGDLVWIDNSFQDIFLKDQISRHRSKWYFIGLRDKYKNGTFFWLDNDKERVRCACLIHHWSLTNSTIIDFTKRSYIEGVFDTTDIFYPR